MPPANPFAKPAAAVIDRVFHWSAYIGRHTRASWHDLHLRALRVARRSSRFWAQTRGRLRTHALIAARRAPKIARAFWAQLAAAAGPTLAVVCASIGLLAYAFTRSWASALHAGALAFIATLLLSIQTVQRRQAAALQGQLDELRRRLHVTEAVLDADDLETTDEMDEVTVARAPRLAPDAAPSTSLMAQLRRFARRLQRRRSH